MTHAQDYTVGISYSGYTLTLTITNPNNVSLIDFDAYLTDTNGTTVYTFTKNTNNVFYQLTFDPSDWGYNVYYLKINSDDAITTVYCPTYYSSKYPVSATYTYEYVIGTAAVGDYTYTFYDDGTASAVVTSTTATQYKSIFSTVYDTTSERLYKLTDLDNCFRYCSSLTTPPVIPFGVISMCRCFFSCSSLEYPPKLPVTVEDLSYCFYCCYVMKTSTNYYLIPENATNLNSMFAYCYGDNWTSKVCLLNIDDAVNAASMFYSVRYSSTYGDARGLFYNPPQAGNLALYSNYLTYGNEMLVKNASSSHTDATISTWPIKTTPSSGTLLDLSLLLIKLLTQLLGVKNTNSTLISRIESYYHTLCKTSSHYFIKYNLMQMFRRHIHTLTGNESDGSYIRWVPLAEASGDGFCKIIGYAASDSFFAAEQTCTVSSSKYVYNLDDDEYETEEFHDDDYTSYFYDTSFFKNLTLWKYGLVWPLRRGNPICMSGKIELEDGDYYINYAYFCTSKSNFTGAMAYMGIFTTYSDDNYYE